MLTDSTPTLGAAPRSGLAPALLTFACGAVVLALRPALPLDEVRYLQVMTETRDLVQLQLNGEPYVDKPPLLFWLGRLASALGLGADHGLRVWPPLLSAATVWIAAALGRRLALPGAGWVQGALLMPFFYGQYVLFDPLLSCGVWAAVACWAARRDAAATAAAGVAILGKGPVALLWLLPLLWATRPLRRPQQHPESRDGRRAAAIVALGLVPLVAWALWFGLAGGPDVRRDLWWARWAGRVHESFAHKEPPWFYVPILLGGLLPLTPLVRFAPAVALDLEGEARLVLRRLVAVGAAVFVAFSAISGKQPHYLLPLGPIAALVFAAVLQRAPRAATWLRRTAAAQVLLLAAVLVTALLRRHDVLDRYGPYGAALVGSSAWTAWLVGTAALLAALALLLLLRRLAPARALGFVTLATALAVAPVHWSAGRLVFPRELRAALVAEPRTTRIAVYGSRYYGLFPWLSGRHDIEKCSGPEGLQRYLDAAPGGLLIATESRVEELRGLGFEPLLTDYVRGRPVELHRVPR